jgi:predicted acyl esterase
MIITPCAHNMPGYHEGFERHPELARVGSTANQAAVLLRWYEAVRDHKTDAWPTVIYYLMGANEWRCAFDWPVPQASPTAFYLGADGALTASAPSGPSPPDRYTYDPDDPTPTVGGSILSYVYPPGSVDVRRSAAPMSGCTPVRPSSTISMSSGPCA